MDSRARGRHHPRIHTLLTRLRCWSSAPGAPRLWSFLLFALALRVPAVLWSHGYEYQDAQYQYVDPAYHLAYGAAWYRTWEWCDGIRSWVYPGLLAALFRVLDPSGDDDPLAVMTWVRGLHAIASLLPLSMLWLCVVRWRPLENARAVLGLAAVAGPLVYIGVKPDGPAFASTLSLAAVLLAMGPRSLHALSAGALLGLAFTCRFSDALFGVSVFAVYAAQRRWRAAAWFSAGALAMACLQGTVDLLTWGSFLHSPLAYFRFNVSSGGSSSFGVEPAWFYVPFVVAGLLLWPPFLRRSIAVVVAGARRMPQPFVAALFYIAVHSLIGRKAARFVVPAFLMLGLVFATGLFALPARRARDRVHRDLFVALNLLALLFLSTYWFNRGPILAALALRAQPEFVRELVVVGGQRDSVGGFFYLDRPELEVVPVDVDDLDEWLDARPSVGPFFVMTVRTPLARGDVPSGWAVEPLGEFADVPELRARSRRFVYRIGRVAGASGAHHGTRVPAIRRS